MEYFDFYLFHNVCEMNIEQYLDPKYGILEYLLKQKENGRIRHLGFSVHGSYDVAKRFLEAYGKHMEFCQIQLNYMDYDFQTRRGKLELLKTYNIPVWVMEPLRGGKLASLAENFEAQLHALRPEESIPGWAFRFLQSLPQVTVTLSGMSNLAQLKQNIEIFSEDKPLNEHERKDTVRHCSTYGQQIGAPLHRLPVLHVTLPAGSQHPLSFRALQRAYGYGRRVPGAYGGFPRCLPTNSQAPASAAAAVKQSAPQQIKISEALADFVQKLQ